MKISDKEAGVIAEIQRRIDERYRLKREALTPEERANPAVISTMHVEELADSCDEAYVTGRRSGFRIGLLVAAAMLDDGLADKVIEALRGDD